MCCPFALLPSLARRFGRGRRRWPRRLRNKWTAIAVLLLFFWLYEWFDLWASPWLTAWIVMGYFVASFVLETLFAESPVCKYVCPLGTLNFANSTISPLQSLCLRKRGPGGTVAFAREDDARRLAQLPWLLILLALTLAVMGVLLMPMEMRGAVGVG